MPQPCCYWVGMVRGRTGTSQLVRTLQRTQLTVAMSITKPGPGGAALLSKLLQASQLKRWMFERHDPWRSRSRATACWRSHDRALGTLPHCAQEKTLERCRGINCSSAQVPTLPIDSAGASTGWATNAWLSTRETWAHARGWQSLQVWPDVGRR